MKKVLLTGASGFIGRQAIGILLEKGFNVHAVSHQSAGHANNVTWHRANLLDANERTALMEKVKPTHVLHFAWIATPGMYWTSPLNEEWKEATVHLLSLSKQAGVRRFVAAGTCAEYDWGSGHCNESFTPLEPGTPYGRAKAECGKIVVGEKEISTAWGRIFFLYGPHEHPKRLVPSVILSLLNGETAKCTHGKQVRDFLHVHDVASAFAALLESSVTGAVNVASGLPVALREVVERIAEQIGRPDLPNFGAIETSPNDPPYITAAVERLQQEVGWKPSISLEQGIAQAVEWWKGNKSTV